MWQYAIPGIITALAGLFGGGGDKGTQMSDTQRAMLEDTLNTQNQRMKVQNPLYEMATQLAMRLMPRSAAVSNPQLYNPYTQSGYTPPNVGRDRRTNTREGVDSSALNETVTRLGRSQLFRMPPPR